MSYQVIEVRNNAFYMTFIEGLVVFNCKSKRLAKLHAKALNARELHNDPDTNLEFTVRQLEEHNHD